MFQINDYPVRNGENVDADQRRSHLLIDVESASIFSLFLTAIVPDINENSDRKVTTIIRVVIYLAVVA